MAGESARDLAKRQRQKAERLMRSAELYEKGAEGEEATARALAALPSDQWTVFHDLCWPGRKLANVDHVAVGPGGVFVIDSKNWTGTVEVKDEVLRQNGYQRETSVASAAEAAIAVSLATPDLPSTLVVPVLCFVRDESVTGWARDVMVCSTTNVADMLASRPPVMDDATRQRVTVALDVSLTAARERVSSASYVDLPSGPAAQVSGKPVKPPRVPRATTSASPRRRGSSSPRWFPPFVASVFLAMVVFVPQVVTSTARVIGDSFVRILTPEPVQPEQPQRKVPRKDRPAREGVQQPAR